MRKLTTLGLFVGAMALSSTARAQSYGMAGCGLGSLLIKDNTTLMQVIAATLNGTGYQTFGITSGTSNCTSGGVVKAQREQAAFAEVNFQDLKRNMAAGGGEFLTSFSSLLGCEEAAKPVLAKMTQTRYESILPTEATSPVQLVENVKSQIKATPALASSCSDERAVARAEGRAQTKNLALATPAAATK
jgi:hypothetical protein